jgi:hypothetical protein
MTYNLRRLLPAAGLTAVLLVWSTCASAITITGTIGPKALISAMPVAVSTAGAVLKISFEDNTPGTNVSFCAGTTADFNAGKCPLLLGASGGPGFISLSITEASQLNGKALYVLRAVGSVPARFTLIIE